MYSISCIRTYTIIVIYIYIYIYVCGYVCVCMYICIFSNLVFSFSVRISRNENVTKTELV